MAALRQSMLTYGYLTPVIIDQNNKIADGEHRALIYKEMGYPTIPAYRLTLESDNDRLMIRQIMNKLHGEHERQLDSNELATIFQRNSNDLAQLSQLIAQRKEDLEHLITAYHPDIWFTRPEEAFDHAKALEEIVPTTELGDCYQLGDHRLICADASDRRSIDRLLQGQKIDLVFTDPPYNIDFDYNSHEDTMKPEDYEQFCRAWFSLLTELSDKVIITPGPKNVGYWYNIKQPTDIATWYKQNSVTWGKLFYKRCCEPILFYGEGFKEFIETNRHERKRLTDFYEYPSDVVAQRKTTSLDDSDKKFAPAKPMELVKELITQYSDENQSILDIFIGSGTTIIAAEQSGRKCFGVEIDPMYCDVIVKRWEKYTNKKAVKL